MTTPIDQHTRAVIETLGCPKSFSDAAAQAFLSQLTPAQREDVEAQANAISAAHKTDAAKRGEVM